VRRYFGEKRRIERLFQMGKDLKVGGGGNLEQEGKGREMLSVLSR